MDKIVIEVGRVSRHCWTNSKFVEGVQDLVGGGHDTVRQILDQVGEVCKIKTWLEEFRTRLAEFANCLGGVKGLVGSV